MRKKYLSALLFGALLVTSAGTFTSCKDYDDEINNLQEQITANADAVKALQDKINSGKWVTELTAIENGFKVTFSDGQSFEIVNGADGTPGADGKPGTEWTIEDDGYWYKDGIKTEYKAAIDNGQNEIIVPTIGEDGYWYLVNEETGELVKSDYKANGAAYAVAEANGGYTLYMPNEDGTDTATIYIPGPAGAISSMEATIDGNDLNIEYYQFTPTDADKKTWKNLTGKDVTSNKYILSSAEEVDLRINPVNVDASDIQFVLYNSKNEKLPNVTFTAEEYKEYVTRGAYGNGLYKLSMKDFELKDDNAKNDFEEYFKSESKSILYALSADINTRADYNIAVADLTKSTNKIGNIVINEKAVEDDKTTSVSGDVKNAEDIDTKAENTVTVEKPEALYGMWLSVSKEDKDLFDIEFDQEKGTFSVNADPDIITKASFVLTVHTMDNYGQYKENEVNIYVSNKISADAKYDLRTLPIVENNTDPSKDKNFFKADMATMTNSLGDNLAVWKKKVTDSSVAYYSDVELKKEVATSTTAGITMSFIDAEGAVANLKDATDMKFLVNNTTASDKFEVNKTYYAKVTFKAGSEELNSIVIPFEFTIPAFTSFFAQEPAVFDSNVAYAYMTPDDMTTGSTAANYKLSRAFQKYLKTAKLSLDSKTKIVGNYTSNDLAAINKATFESEAMITLKTVAPDQNTKVPAGYGKELIVNASAADYLGWDYPEGEGTYTFKVKVMSPLFEGKVTAIDDVVKIPATSVDGYKLGNNDITGATYNNIAYKVLPDKVNGTTPTWSRPEIANVEAVAKNENVLKKIDPVNAATSDGKVLTEGYFTIIPQNINTTTDTEITIKVTDVWGYVQSNPIKVQVTVEK